jgi:hypothetical protein
VDEDGLIKTAPANSPRFDHDPVTGECLGLLIEEQRSNLITRSNDFSNSVWSGYCGGKSNLTYNTTDVIAPDGLFTSTKVARGSNGCDGSLAWGVLWNSGIGGTIINTTDTYTASIWARGLVGGEVINVGFNDSQMTNHTLSTSWIRITRVGVANTTDRGFQVKSDAINQTFYIWGAQLETGAFPTSYIPTSGSTVTRTPDNASMTGTNFSSWYNQSEGTIYCAFKLNSTGTARVFNIDDGTNTNRISGLVGSTFYQTFINPANAGPSVTPSTTYNFKIASGHQDNNIQIYVNSIYQNSNTLITIPKNLNTFRIGNWQSNTLQGTTISQLTYYPVRLPNSQLQTLTK